MKIGIMAAMAVATAMAAALTGCATEEQADRNKLEFDANANSGTLLVGDTSNLWKASRTVIEANGRESTDKDYTFFHLVSSDTTVAAVIRSRQLLGRKAGEVTVKGVDDKSSLQTETSIKVTVSDKP
jgi:hypothetical protein